MDLTSELVQEAEDCMIDLEDSGNWEEIGWDDVKKSELPAESRQGGRSRIHGGKDYMGG